MQTNTIEQGIMVTAPFKARAHDYQTIAKAMAYINDNWQDHPALEEIAKHIGLSTAHFQRLFVNWAGISPKDFLQAMTLDHARSMLKRGASVLDTAFEVGLSGPGRLHDLFVHYEAMTPGDFKTGGAGLEIIYGFHPSPFGIALVMATPRGLAGLGFADGEGEKQNILQDMIKRWPAAHYRHAQEETAGFVARIFNPDQWENDNPLKIVLIGSSFDVTVWQALLKIPPKSAVTYGGLAAHIGKPKAARAVGSAVGRNPIAFVVPCHRVLRKSGALGGYHWGLARKRALIGWDTR